MKKILWLTNIPSPYRVDFFNELGKHTELTVTFEKRTSKERDQSWHSYDFHNFKAVFLRGMVTDTDKAFCPGIVSYLRDKRYNIVMVSDIATPTGIFAILYLKMKRIPYYIEGDGGIAKNGKGLKEKLKKLLIRNAKAYFSTSGISDQYFLQYGANKQNIYRYPFTSVMEADISSDPVTDEEKQKRRKELGIPYRLVIISVGRLIHRKGFDLLVEAARELEEDVGIYIVGTEVTSAYAREVLSKIPPQVHFIPYQSKEELALYYQAADVFVLPTREDIWGLVVNEAMSYGLPVITTNRCIAGIELVKDYENGFLIPAENPEAIVKQVHAIINNKELKNEMAKEGLKKIQNYTIEKMAETHMKLFEELDK